MADSSYRYREGNFRAVLLIVLLGGSLAAVPVNGAALSATASTSIPKPMPRDYVQARLQHYPNSFPRYAIDNNPLTAHSFDNNTLVTLEYNVSMSLTGWDVVVVDSPLSALLSNATNVYYGAGYIEGYFTAESIYNMYLDFELDEFSQSRRHHCVHQFIANQISEMRSLGRQPDPDGVYFAGYSATLAKIMAQLDGLTAGYKQFVVDNAGNTTAQALTLQQLYYISFQTEIWDVETYCGVQRLKKRHKKKHHGAGGNNNTLKEDHHVRSLRHPLGERKRKMGQHCSAMIKLTDDDLFVAHNTWSSMNWMLRQYKTYNFETTVSMSSYPGMLVSSDDWYITSNGLAIMETSNDIWDDDAYDTPAFSTSTVSAWVRAMTATYLAQKSHQWQAIFLYKNSGTYNNQWMVVDMKLYKPKMGREQLPHGLFWVSETLPGESIADDMTHILRENTYWPSYNIPYFPKIFDGSGNLWMEQQYGSYFSYSKYARPLIFARNQSMIKDLEGVKALMRYNDYLYDPLSRIPNCSATVYNNTCRPAYSTMLAIAPRGDLEPVGNQEEMGPLADPDLNAVGQQNEATIDCKIVSYKQMMNGKFYGVVISGPTTSGGSLPVFDFRTAPPLVRDTPHYGLPDRWDFDWVTYHATVDVRPLPVHQHAGKQALADGLIGSSGILLLISCIVVFYLERQVRRHSIEKSARKGGLGLCGDVDLEEELFSRGEGSM